MAIWLLKATWTADEDEASEQWEVSAPSAQAAINDASAHFRFSPLRVEVSQRPQDIRTSGLKPGEVRRIPPA